MKKLINLGKWADIVGTDLFGQMNLAALAVLITSAALFSQNQCIINNANFGFIIYYDVILTIVCFAFAYIRMWKNKKEEAATCNAWDIYTEKCGSLFNILDIILEPLYIFSCILFLLSAVFYQIYVVAYVVLFITMTPYNIMHIIGANKLINDKFVNMIEIEEHKTVKDYFIKRIIIDSITITVLTLMTAFSYVLDDGVGDGGGIGYDKVIIGNIIAVFVIILLEVIFEPLFNYKYYSVEKTIYKNVEN